MPPRFWRAAWKKSAWLQRLSGATLEPSQAQNAANTYADERAAADRKRWSEEYLASPIPSPANRLAQTMIETYGRPLLRSLARIHPSTSYSSRMFRECLLPEEPSESSTTWTDWVSGFRQTSLRRRKRAQATGASGCSYSESAWDTPKASHADKGGPNMRDSQGRLQLCSQAAQWKTPHGMSGIDHSGKLGGVGEFAKQAEQWQTPGTDSFRKRGGDRRDEMGLDQEARQWPTPRTVTGGSESAERKKHLGRMESGGGDLQAIAIQFTPPDRPTSTPGVTPSNATRHLNPRFAAWLMGWPPDWACVLRSCEPLEMAWWRYRQRWHLFAWLRRYSSMND